MMLILCLAVETHVEGIPRFAAFQNSNDSFSIIRKFGDQTFRLLIMKEIEICQITEKLQALDKEDEADDSKQYRLTSIENDASWDQTQRELLQEYEEKVLSYCEKDTCVACLEDMLTMSQIP